MRINVYERLSTVFIDDVADDLETGTIEHISHSLHGPADASLFLPKRINEPINFRGTARLELSEGLEVAYDGEITSHGYLVGADAQQGIRLEGAGFWGTLLGKRLIDKRWADNRLSADVWRVDPTATAAELATVDRNGRIRITPKAEAWANNQLFSLIYTMPSGQTIKRVTCDYDLAESVERRPNQVLRHNGSTDFNLPNTYDGDEGTSNNVTLTTSDYLYVWCPAEWVTGLRFAFGGTVNANAATIAVQYFDEQSAGWVAITSITDGTASGGATFAQDGSITWSAPTQVSGVTHSEKRGYWLRLQPSANLTANVTIQEVYVLGAQAWELRLYDPVGATNVWSVTSSGGGSQDVTLGTPRQSLKLQLISRAANQVPTNDGAYYGEVSNLIVYSETGSINLTEIVKDCIGVLAADSVMNSSEDFAESNSLSLVPFYTDGPESWASILERAAAYGDGSQNEWRVYIVPSRNSPSPDGKPALGCAAFDSLETYTYAVSLNEADGPVELLRDFAGVVNYVIVAFRDEENNRDLYLTPDDDSDLMDQTSIDRWGERHLPTPLNIGAGSQTMALNVGKRYLAAHKDPKFIVSGALQVRGFIRGNDNEHVPASLIKAGPNIKLENFLEDVSGVSGAGLTFRVTRVTYDPAEDVASIYTGTVPDAIDILLAQQVLLPARTASPNGRREFAY